MLHIYAGHRMHCILTRHRQMSANCIATGQVLAAGGVLDWPHVLECGDNGPGEIIALDYTGKLDSAID